jgi:predicted HAD superfamily phosphohydrolase
MKNVAFDHFTAVLELAMEHMHDLKSLISENVGKTSYSQDLKHLTNEMNRLITKAEEMSLEREDVFEPEEEKIEDLPDMDDEEGDSDEENQIEEDNETEVEESGDDNGD